MERLERELALYSSLKEELKNEYGLEDGDQALVDTLDGSTDLKELLGKMAERAQTLERHAARLRKDAADIEVRARNKETQAERLRVRLLGVMDDAGIATVETPYATTSTKWNPSTLIIPDNLDLSLLPPECVKVERKLRKKVLVEFVKSGLEVPGVVWGNRSRSLQIR